MQPPPRALRPRAASPPSPPHTCGGEDRGEEALMVVVSRCAPSPQSDAPAPPFPQANLFHPPHASHRPHFPHFPHSSGFSVSAFQHFSVCHLAAKPPFRPNYFHFCTCVKSVLTPPNPRIHNGLAGFETAIFDQKIVRTVRRRFFQNHAILLP